METKTDESDAIRSFCIRRWMAWRSPKNNRQTFQHEQLKRANKLDYLPSLLLRWEILKNPTHTRPIPLLNPSSIQNKDRRNLRWRRTPEPEIRGGSNMLRMRRQNTNRGSKHLASSSRSHIPRCRHGHKQLNWETISFEPNRISNQPNTPQRSNERGKRRGLIPVLMRQLKKEWRNHSMKGVLLSTETLKPKLHVVVASCKTKRMNLQIMFNLSWKVDNCLLNTGKQLSKSKIQTERTYAYGYKWRTERLYITTHTHRKETINTKAPHFHWRQGMLCYDINYCRNNLRLEIALWHFP